MKARFLALAALVLGLASCQTEPEGLDVNVGGAVDTTITVSLPETTRANSAVGAFDNVVNSNEYTVRYILQVFYKGEESGADRQVIYSDGKTVNFPVRLVPGREYSFVAWADVVLQDGKTLNELTSVENTTLADLHYDTNDLKNITLKNETWVAMDETRDAFTDVETLEYYGNSTISLELIRPFAKLRVVTTDMVELRNLGIIPAYATVAYDTEYRNAFDALAGKAKDAGSDKKAHTTVFAIKDYTDFANDPVKKDTHKVLFTDYFFANEGDAVSFVLNVYEDAAGQSLIKSNDFNTDIAVNRNYLTTIQGNVLTDGNNIEVKVEDAFENSQNPNDKPYYNEIVEVGNATDLQEAINESTEETTIVLGGDIDLGDGIITLAATRAEAPQYALLVPADKVVNLDLNGKTIRQEKECTANYSMLVNKGTLTIKGNGKISFKDTGAGDPNYGWGSYTIRNEGTLTVENGTIEHLGEQDAHMICAIFQYSGHSTINGGKISTPNYRSARLWSGDMTINGGEFEGQLWLQAVNDTSDLTINGGTFAPRGGDSSSVFVTNSGHSVKFAVNGGHFTTKIGMSEPFGCITGGTFTTAAKEGTNVNILAKGYAFIDGENGDYTVVNTGHYTDAEGNHYITNAKGLAWVSENVNTMEFYVSGSANIFDNKTVYLANDIDLGGAEWRPIGDYAFSRTSFNGVFDGQGYTVSNFKVTEPVRWTEKVTEASYGFFGNVKGTIKNLTIKNATVNPEGGRYSAALVGRLHNGGCIENCHVENSSVTILHWQVGGLVGQNNNGNISDCSVVGSTITGKAAVGAIVGMDMTAGEHTIENCRVANTALVQNESFGASYDASYGLAVGLVNASGIILNIDNFVAENNTIKDIESNTLVGDMVDGVVIKIDGKSAEEIAFAETLAKGGTVTLSNDIVLNTAIQLENTVVILDLNGKTVTAPKSSAFEAKNGAELTIKNGKVVAYESTVRAVGGKAVIESGEYTSTGTAVDSPATYRYSLDCREGGELIINGGTFKSNNGMINVGSTVTINGGKFENIVEKTMTRHFAYVSAPLTINDGEFYGKANSSAGGCFFCGAAASGDIQVNGGKFTSLWTSGSVNRIFEVYYGGTINVTGGLFNTNGGITSFVTANTDEATKAAYPYVAK